MKNKIYISLIIVVLAAISYFIYWKYFSLNSIGEKVFESIEKGNLAYAPTLQGPVLIDLDDLTTDIFVKDLLLISGISPEPDAVFDKQPKVYNIPSSINEHELIDINEYNDSFLTYKFIRYKDYQSYGHYTSKNYKDFVSKELNKYSDKQGFKFDTINQLIIYQSSPIKETRFRYKIKTIEGNYIMQLMFLNIGETKKLAAIFCNEN